MNHHDYLPTRHSLLHRLKNWEDQESWKDFFETYWRFIYGVAVKAGLSDDEAQDVVQETVITVAKKINDFQVGSERGSFKAWLTRTTKWRIGDQFRKRARAGAALSTPGDDSAPTAAVEQVADPVSLQIDESWEKDWEHNILEVALENLKPKVDSETYQMFHLHIIKRWPAAKVASSVGAKVPSVYFAKYKVSRLLKKEIERLNKDLI